MNTKMDFSPHTDVKNHGLIKSMRIPAGWKDGPHEHGGGGFRSLKSFLAPQNPQVTISLFYRGFPLSEQGSASFRHLLNQGPSTVFIARDKVSPGAAEIELFSQLREVLGNSGNNQIVNNKTDWRGHSFHVNRVEVLEVNGRNLLSVQGWFRNPEENERGREYAGLFIDTNPAASESGVQEIFLEAPDAESFARFNLEFSQAISSIVWE